VLPVGWKKYTLWQFTDRHDSPPPHTVRGIGPCDRNQFDGSIAQLRKR
jgi:lysozyme